MTTTNLNISPFYDDYKSTIVDTGELDHNKGFNQILFKPGYAVQARELTQLQSILKDQIAKFGSHIFKHGSVVIPGNSTSDLNVCYVKLQATNNDLSILENQTIVSSASGLTGIIRKVVLADTLTSTPATLYVSYKNVGTSGESIFGDNEELQVTINSVTYDFTTALTSACGGASMAFVNRGVYFVNGTFATVEKQSVVIGNTTTPTASVMLKVTESIVTVNDDDTLLDPAQGSYNYAAPGADRLKINLELVVTEVGSFANDHIELMRFDEGVLQEHLRYPKYNELEKSLARRTYDESGDYIVSGLDVSVREHLKSTVNNGRYEGGDSSKLVVTVNSGKAYIGGFEVEKIAPTEIEINKARTTESSFVSVIPSYGQYLYVTLPDGLPAFSVKETVTLYTSANNTTSIGSARVLTMDLVVADSPVNTSVWKLFVTDISITSAEKTVSDISYIGHGSGSFQALHKYNVTRSSTVDFTSGYVVKSGSKEATVHLFDELQSTLYVYKHSSTASIPSSSDIITEFNGGSPTGAGGRINSLESVGKNTDSSLLVELSPNYVASTSDLSYKLWYQSSYVSNGLAQIIDVSGMTIDTLEEGGIFIVDSEGDAYPKSFATTNTSTRITISPITSGRTVHVYISCTKSGADAIYKSKEKTETFDTIAAASTITLTKADGIRLISIVSSELLVGDVTTKYTFSGGQTDYAYNRSFITLNSGETLPAGNLTITYEYFAHVDSGDYFSVNSYSSDVDWTEYYSSPILSYRSNSSGKVYDLRKYLDFRPRIGEDDTYTGTGAMVTNVIQPDSVMSCTINSYTPRIDSVVCDRSGQITVLSGVGKLNPKAPVVKSTQVQLASLYIPPYTFSITDIQIKTDKNRVYTMKDVGKLEDRIFNIENYVLLSQTENDSINYEVIDANTGLTRYKTGYLVDTFNDMDKIADVLNPAFKVTYESETIIPQFDTTMSHLVPTTTGLADVQVTGNAITLPYTSVEMIKQPLSSKITNLNPFSVFSWVGEMKINPSSDSWIVTENLPAIINNRTQTVTETVTITRPWNSPTPLSVQRATIVSAPTPFVRVR